MKYEKERKLPQEPRERQAGTSAAEEPVILEEWDGEHPSLMALSLYLSEENPDRGKVLAFTRHFAGCPECRRLASAMQTLERAASLAGEYGEYAEEELEDFLDRVNEHSGISAFSPDKLTRENLADWSVGEVVFRFSSRWDGGRFLLGEEGAESLRLSCPFRGEYLRLSVLFRDGVLCLEMEGRKNGWHDFPVLFLYPKEGTDFAAEILEPGRRPDGKPVFRLELEGLRRENFEAELKISRYDF